MSGFTPEQEMMLLARAVVEVADAVKWTNGGEPEGPGLAYARQLIAAADEGLRGLGTLEMQDAHRIVNERPKPWDVPNAGPRTAPEPRRRRPGESGEWE
jgi:hypothetical protein